ncbi:MAG: glutaredoxin family protein [Thermodesulfobacteriota bacterium]
MARSALGRSSLFPALLAALLAFWPGAVHARSVAVHFFWAEGCPHCVREKAFLASLQAREPWIEIRSYEVVYDAANMELFQEAARVLGANAAGVPLTVVCDRAVTGWLGEEATGAQIEALAGRARSSGCTDVVAKLAAREAPSAVIPPGPGAPGAPSVLTLPFFGEIRAGELSLPLLTVAFAAVDGFNPCAMWVLLLLVGVLLGMDDRARMWILGGVFLLSSGVMYYAVLAAWMNVLLAAGHVRWLRTAIGLLALAGGTYSLREALAAPPEACPAAGARGRARTMDRLRKAAREPRLWLAAAGMALLAVTVNFVELVCSAGLPAVYTQVLALSGLPAWKHHALLGLYVAVFMLDDVAVFVAAMATLRLTGLSGRYSRASRVLGAVILLVAGGLLIFRPEWLMFG